MSKYPLQFSLSEGLVSMDLLLSKFEGGTFYAFFCALSAFFEGGNFWKT